MCIRDSLHTDKNGVTLYTRPYEGSDIMMIKVTTEINVPAVEGLKFLRDGDNWISFNETIDSYKDLKKIDISNKYTYLLGKSLFIVSARDAVQFESEIELEDDSYIRVLMGIKDDRFSRESDSAVELDVNIHCYHFEPIDDNKCKVTKIIHASPGGSIPSSTVNWLVGANHDQFVKLKEVLEK